MNTFAFIGFLVSFYACVTQRVFGQCLSNEFALGFGAGNIGCGNERGNGLSIAHNLGNGYGWNAVEVVGAYGGAGTGDLDVDGQLPVTAGVTTVVGQVPILGAVQFRGEVPSAGTDSIFGKCGCDCNGGLLF